MTVQTPTPLQSRITKAERTTLANLLAIDPATITAANIGELREQAKATDPTKGEGEGASKAEPKPELPTVQFSLGAYQLTYHKPTVTLPDGSTVKCPHTTWGHESEASAKACARKLASENSVKLAAPASAA